MALGFAVLILLTVKVHHEAPPIPDAVAGSDGSILYSGNDIRCGQQVFLKYELMDNGTIWGRAAMLRPDFYAEFLHRLALHEATSIAQQRHGRPLDDLAPSQRAAIEAEVRIELKRNHYDPQTRVLTVTPALMLLAFGKLDNLG